jgi:hypothetical protein
MPETLAAELERIQRGRNEAWRALAVRLERAQAALNRAACEALAQRDPASKAAVLDAVEAHLGHPVQFELCSLADPELFAALGRRGYIARDFQFVWQRPLDAVIEEPMPEGLEVRRLGPEEAPACQRVLLAGFMECAPEDVPQAALEAMPPMPQGECLQLYGALLGSDLIGGATLYVEGDTATLAGTAVVPRNRGRGSGCSRRRRVLTASSRVSATASSRPEEARPWRPAAAAPAAAAARAAESPPPDRQR